MSKLNSLAETHESYEQDNTHQRINTIKFRGITISQMEDKFKSFQKTCYCRISSQSANKRLDRTTPKLTYSPKVKTNDVDYK